MKGSRTLALALALAGPSAGCLTLAYNGATSKTIAYGAVGEVVGMVAGSLLIGSVDDDPDTTFAYVPLFIAVPIVTDLGMLGACVAWQRSR